MTDRELLELAAKAAGLDGEVKDHGGELWFYAFSPCVCWNPLIHDGDALRLAVKFGFMIDGENCLVSYGGNNWFNEGDEEIYDPYAATRRAIVRAAAEIGRNMK